ncbi:hypothetical protein [Streptomyces sp. NPDC059874]|uniref:RCC1 domain-containing protein n=1 Tax=Streptomyces sp. NPDC059874 TaxID=3346983 RepID=UPI00366422B0
MRFKLGGRSRGRALALGVAALLWSGFSPGAAPGAFAADGGASAEPGNVLAWGSNANGQLGDATTISRSTTPVSVCAPATCVSSLDRVIALEAGTHHSVALRADGTVWTWGSNAGGQLGDGSFSDRTTPVRVCAPGQTAPGQTGTCSSFLTGVIAVAAGDNHSLALRSDGTVLSWGANTLGQLGTSSTGFAWTTPVGVCQQDTFAGPSATSCGSGVLTGVTAIAAGGNHNLALRTNGNVVSWGDNSNGQLGRTSSGLGNTIPRQVGLTGVTAIAAGSRHSLALRTTGTVAAWGANTNGQLGNGNSTQQPSPVTVCESAVFPCRALSGVTAISAGGRHSVSLHSDTSVRVWGANDNSQLGIGFSGTGATSVPVRPCAIGSSIPCGTRLTDVTAISAGGNHTLAKGTGGTVAAWGDNGNGQIGDGSTTDRGIPVLVPSLETATAVAAGGEHSLAIVRSGADVALALSAEPEPVPTGSNLTYTVTVTNHGPQTAENVVFNDTLPPNARFVSATPGQGSCVIPPSGSSDTVTCSLGTLAGGTQATTEIVLRVIAPEGGTVTDKATVTTSSPDPNQVNNTATIETPVDEAPTPE